MDAAAVGAVDEVVDRVEERLPFGPLGVEQHEVGLLARLDRAELLAQPERPGAGQRRHLERRLRRDLARVLPRVLVLDRRHVHRPHQIEIVRVVRRVAAERHPHAPGQELRHLAVLRHTPPTLGGRAGAHSHRRLRPGQAVDLGVVQAEHVGEEDVRPEHADRFEVFRRAEAVAGQVFLARLRAAPVVQRESGPALVRHALHPAEEVGAAALRRERHRPCARRPSRRPSHLSMKEAVRAMASSVP